MVNNGQPGVLNQVNCKGMSRNRWKKSYHWKAWMIARVSVMVMPREIHYPDEGIPAKLCMSSKVNLTATHRWALIRQDLPLLLQGTKRRWAAQVSVIPHTLNPFTLKGTLESIVCYSYTFENNLGIKPKFTKYLKESYCLASDEHFSFKYFHENTFISKIFPKSSGLFWQL